MRLLTGVDHLGPQTGACVSTMQTSRALVGRGYEVDVVYVNDGGYGEEYASFARSVTQVPHLLSYGLREAVRKAPRWWPGVRAGRAARPDLVWDNAYWSLPWARAVARSVGCPVVCEHHGFIDPPNALDRLLRHAADLFLPVSHSVARELAERGVPEDRIRVVHAGIEPDRYPPGDLDDRARSRAELGLPDEAYVVLYYGRLHPNKGVEVAIDAFQRLDVATELLILGGAETDVYAASLRTRDRTGRARFLGHRDDVLTPLHAADVVVVPSMWPEPFGRTVIEGLATGRPVIASAVGGIPEILTGPFAELLFPRGDVDALVDRIEGLRDWRRDDPALGERCTEHVRSSFTLERKVDALDEVFRSFAGTRPRSTRRAAAAS